MRQRQLGFTLVELMIALIIISVLAAIAIPSYQGYIARSNRTAVKALMTEIASRQESFLSDRRAYATTLTALGYTDTAATTTLYLTPGGTLTTVTGTEVLYSLALTIPAAGTWTLTATPLNLQARRDTECTALTLQSSGLKSATGSAPNSCWG